MATKNVGKMIFKKSHQLTLLIPCLGVKNFDQIAVSRTVSQIDAFLRFTQKFKMATKNVGKMIFGKSHQLTLLIPCLGVKNFDQIAISHTVSQINAFLHFTQKFKMAAKNGRKTIFGKTCQLTQGIPWRSKIVTKSLYLALLEIFTRFYFPLKSKMAAIICEN